MVSPTISEGRDRCRVALVGPGTAPSTAAEDPQHHEQQHERHGQFDRIPNYGGRRRAGEAISISFVESAVNQVISKRMAKKQQMR